MPLIRFSIIISSIFVLFSCVEEKTDHLDQYTNKEKDSISNFYNEYSTPGYLYQPSEIHRTFKDSALHYNPNNISARQKLSYSYKKVGDHIKAMQILNKAVDLNSINKNAEGMQYRAWTLLYFYRDYEGTIRDVDSIKKITGNVYNICWGEPCDFQKGQALYKLKKYEKAIEAFNLVNTEEKKKGFDTDDNFLIYFYKGRCYAELGKQDLALKNFEKAINSAEYFPEAYYQMGLVYKSLNDKENAEKFFKKAYEYKNYKMQEPYFERFDEVFPYMIERKLNSLN